jgi:hypothetical protein
MTYMLMGNIEITINEDEYNLLHDTLIKYRINRYLEELVR